MFSLEIKITVASIVLTIRQCPSKIWIKPHSWKKEKMCSKNKFFFNLKYFFFNLECNLSTHSKPTQEMELKKIEKPTLNEIILFANTKFYVSKNYRHFNQQPLLRKHWRYFPYVSIVLRTCSLLLLLLQYEIWIWSFFCPLACKH